MTAAAIALYLTASATVYAFSASLGERAGLDTGAVGYAASLVGLAGAGAATALNVRWGRTIPVLGFCVGFILYCPRALPVAQPDRLRRRPLRIGRHLLLLDAYVFEQPRIAPSAEAPA